MAMLCSTNVYDALLDHIVQNTSLMSVCTTQPTASSNASSSGGNYARAFASVSSGHWTKADSTASGRKVTSTQYASLTVTSSGAAQHVALVGNSTLLYVTTCATKQLTTSDTVTIPGWAIHVLSPTSST
jgi:hypothetical protein